MILRWSVIVFVSLLLFGTTGCQEKLAWVGAHVYQADTKAPNSKTAAELVREGLNASPRIRVGYLPTPTLGTVFSGPEQLGQHGYRPNLSERNGLVYTCKAGPIDIGHARKAADWTVFLAAKTYRQIMKGEPEFSFRLYEPSRYFVALTYPENWKDLPQQEKERIAYEVSTGVGQYLAFVGVTWHEIITWFGFKSKGLEPEHPSAFTWEETFSNLFGTHVATLALEDCDHTFNEAMTLAFDRELRKLDVQPGHVSKRAAESVRGPWFTGDFFFIVMKKRNLDLGLDDGFVTPTLIPSVSECEGAAPQAFPVPNLEFVSEYGFRVKFEIEPNIWEGNAILDIAYAHRKPRRDCVEPVVHLAPIMAYIRQDAKRRYGSEADLYR
ncbi:MAG: hypothetical protein AMJ65_10240 [Phycisphaerae bacterium SG8_4]|nr:MAG: hypothetical protein AMJ65_10240 [Phycisphaerae bacterium SG8_4]